MKTFCGMPCSDEDWGRLMNVEDATLDLTANEVALCIKLGQWLSYARTMAKAGVIEFPSKLAGETASLLNSIQGVQ